MSVGFSVGFMVAACVFVLVLSCAVACADWWREPRLVTPRLRVAASIKTDVEPVRPTTDRRAA
jgi:hypothetical protein